MNWDALGAIAELVGALGVIATLGYLAVQIRQNTTVVRTSNFQSLMTDLTSLTSSISGNPEVAEFFTKALASYEALSAPEKIRFQWMISDPFRGAQTSFLLHRRGLIDEELYADYMSSFLSLLRAPGVREYWASGRHWWHKSFREFVDAKLLELAA